MRRLPLLLGVLLMLVPAPPARAQSGEVTLRLAHQTPWNDPKHPKLALAVRAVNRTDQTLDDLSLGITIQSGTGSRSEYEQSLQSDTGEVILGTAPLLTGSLAPNQSRTFKLPPIDLSVLAQRAETAIYPMKVELRSHDEPMATLRSPVIFVQQEPQQPLDMTWTFVLSAPILYQPDGTFRTPWLQQQVSRGGQLRNEVEALTELTQRRKPPGLDVVISPQLVEQLVRMRRGYSVHTGGRLLRVPPGHGGAADADVVLRDLHAITASHAVQLSALPFSAPSLPALIRAGLTADLDQQLLKGRQEVVGAVGGRTRAGILHPPGSRLDQQSLYELHRAGVRLLLVDPDTVVQPEQARGFAKAPDASLSVDVPPPLHAIVPDDGVQRILESSTSRQDPHLAAQSALGELAAIWLEQPSVDRGVAVMFSQRDPLPPGFFGPFVHSINAAPWLRPVKATTMIAEHPPSEESVELGELRGPTFTAGYVVDLLRARQQISAFRSTLTEESTLPDELDQLVLVAESGQFASQEDEGEAFLQSVIDRVSGPTGEFKRVAPDVSEPVTLASRSGVVPVSITNQSGHPVRVKVALRSARLSFAHGASQIVEIPENGATLTFSVQARTTGRFPVQVVISTPDGATTLSQGRLVVRSTAYNRIALVLTIGAALFLLALWARRFLPWTNR